MKKLVQKKARIKKKERLKKAGGHQKNDIAGVVAMWTKIPVSKLEEKESERLLKLESILHKRVIGQDEAVSSGCARLCKPRQGRTAGSQKRPIGSFLFLGPTGRREDRAVQGAGGGYCSEIGECA